ncbi:MAG: hypothetical protein WA971_06690 [Microbacterium sp.]
MPDEPLSHDPDGVPLPPLPQKGPGTWAGVGIGCGLHVLGVLVMIVAMNLASGGATVLSWIWPFILILIASVLTMFSAQHRRLGAGMLIVSAAAWLVLIGPCVLLVTSI